MFKTCGRISKKGTSSEGFSKREQSTRVRCVYQPCVLGLTYYQASGPGSRGGQGLDYQAAKTDLNLTVRYMRQQP